MNIKLIFWNPIYFTNLTETISTFIHTWGNRSKNHFFKVITTIVYIIFSQTYDKKKNKEREVYVIIQFILLKPDFLIYDSDT